MTQEVSQYWTDLRARLTAFGMSHAASIPADKNLTDIDPQISIERWTAEEHVFLISKGCSRHPGAGHNQRDEFMIETGGDEIFSRRLLTFTMYFHLTHRPILPADCLAIGTMPENTHGYSHVFVSVPFFLPGDINFIGVKDLKFALNWLMPIAPEEEEYIRLRGSDEFEQRLNASGYGFFDRRTNFQYLMTN